MTGKDICWKMKKAPPCEPELNRDELPQQKSTIPVEVLASKEVLHH